MPLNISRLLLTLACLAVLSSAQAVQAEPAQPSAQAAEVKPAPDAWRPVVQGQLKNGLRYAILPRKANEQGVGFFLRVEGGFIAERRPGERGLAHLIEHLVFHSPTGSAPDQLRRFREIGFPLTLPEPAGGTTSWRESDYFVVSRSTQLSDLDALLGLYREIFSELTFRADAVDLQRAEVMREMADKQLGNDIYAHYIAAVAPGSPTDVIDAQNSDDVPTASVDTIRALYERLYRPENVSIVIVGDVDPAQIEALIASRFDDWRGSGPEPHRVAIPVFQGSRIAPISYSALKYGRNSATITVAMPLSLAKKSRARQADAIVMDLLAIRAVNNRLAITRASHPPGKFGFYIENGDHGHRLLIMWDDFVPGRWQPAVADLKSTACALTTTGLTKAEWDMAKRDLLQELKQRAENIGRISNFEVSRDLSNSLTYRRDLIPPDELLRRAQTWLDSLGTSAANGWLRGQLRSGAEHVRVESPELENIDNADAAIRATLDEAIRNTSCAIQPS